VIRKGSPVPKDFQIWTGGTASGEEARQAIFDKQGVGEEEPKVTDLVADGLDDGKTDFEKGVGIEGYDAAHDAAQEAQEGEVIGKYETSGMDETLKMYGIDKLKVNDFTEDFDVLEEILTNTLDDIDLRYEKAFTDMRAKNKNVDAALQAKLIKAGVSLDGHSFESAVAGETTRGEARIAELERLKQQEIASAKNDKHKNFMSLSAQERNESFDVNMANMNSFFQAEGLNMSVWDSFNARSDAEKQREQQAQEHLETLKANKEEGALDTMIGFLEEGLYDMYNEDTVRMLYDTERTHQMEPGTLVDAGVGAYWDRVSNMDFKYAQTQNMIASTQEKQALLPYKMEKYAAEIAQSRAAATKSLRVASVKSGDADLANSTNNLLKEIEENFYGERMEDGELVKIIDPKTNKPVESFVGSDKKINTKKYKESKNLFIEIKDPELKNEKYFNDLFMDWFPPNAFLNEDDPTAIEMIEEFKQRGKGMWD